MVKTFIGWIWRKLWWAWYLAIILVVCYTRECLRKKAIWDVVAVFMDSLTPKFYIALTATSSFISALIMILEWIYFQKYGVSFIEQFSLNYISPWIGGGNDNNQQVPECKVWRNPLGLFRGAEYSRYLNYTKREPLTFYDMNLSAQDHQAFFICDADNGKPDYEIMQAAWRERVPAARVKAAHLALEKNADCVTALIMLAEEEAPTMLKVEKILRKALKLAEANYKRTQKSHHLDSNIEMQHRRDLNVLIYIKRRIAMCCRKLRKLKEAVKMFRDLSKEMPPIMNILNVHENLIEVLLETQSYADVQSVLAKYDDINLPKSAVICYTSALLKIRVIADKYNVGNTLKKGLTQAEEVALEAIHRAVEFNPHVPKYLLEMKSYIFPPEHILKRGDSEAVAYAFFHLAHWKRIKGALAVLNVTWESAFNQIPYPLEKGYLFHPYPTCTELADRELLPTYHKVSVFPKKDLPFFIHFTAGLSSFSALLALLIYLHPQFTGNLVYIICMWIIVPVNYCLDRLETMLPNNVMDILSNI
ncbi:suppressor of tumorigenicity 7 protein homolog isoform X1 [Acyrthosiphon pisum]|uniref:Protein ST7 homolog n=1 Tax=Acyrthosiphon pisum TaxID=7029 RepID=A0A8R1W687_ACYPI|nr:suppressor of tumorigenicity 7 protein homolog isoform X1 [Acyrthosiphon pisum]|eukprot:XP_001949568.1 PREDICTED: suppressor of tumorigenicity 7 protein homolog [Acyrthosiphon pisum]